jgi:DnaK suppressor protein
MKDNSSDNTGLTTAEISNFKAVLTAKRNEILGNVSSMETETLRRERSDLSNMPIHMADSATDNYDVENTLDLIDSERKLLLEINDALERIDNKTYGICQADDAQIPKARLLAIPWAKYCVKCANIIEKGFGEKFRNLHSDSYEYKEDEEDEDENTPNLKIEKL